MGSIVSAFKNTSSTTSVGTVSFKQVNVGRWLVWTVTAILFAVLPLIFSKGFSITLLSQMGILVIFCLSYNMLFGQGGMLSFGHAVYAGLGAFFAVHAMNLASAGKLPIPVWMIPLVGGVFGAVFGVVFGYLTTKKAGTPFAMITLGLAEMVFAAVLMFPGFFGGEGGITTNRVYGTPLAGWNFGSGLQVYYLIAIWCMLCMIAMFAFSRTPLGRISNAVRDNPERVEFIGYNTQRVRYLVLIVSAFFAGISGGLAAINFEIVSAENVHPAKSGAVLLATVIGGASFFFGPILGAVIFILFAVALSEWTKAWQLYLGVFFILMVMFAPGGLASIVLMNLRVMKYKLFGRLRDSYMGLFVTGVLFLLGIICILELGYHLTLERADGTTMSLLTFKVDSAKPETWLLALSLLIGGGLGFEFMRRQFRREWDAAQVEIEEQIARESRV
jgi:branched-chain amino acid transport system permease protein